jgi:hypothetical protein
VPLGQGLDCFLLRKTCGAGRRSDEAGRRLVDDLGACGFDTIAHGKTRDIVSLAEHGDLLAFQHELYLSCWTIRIHFEDEGYSIIELG